MSSDSRGRGSPGSDGWAALGAIGEALRTQRQHEAAAREREAARRHAEERERRLFVDAVGPVTPLAPHRRRPHDAPRAKPHPRQRELDEQAALREAWSDAVDVESLLLTDDGLGFRREGVPADVLARLRRGQWAIQGQLDLHGLRRDEARDALAGFLAGAERQGWRCLRVVHGKGLGSPGRAPVLKAKVQRWLAQSAAVIAFAQASGPQGGAGALIVLLRGSGR
ncbi:MAG: Smr/MutS family protein [Rubrivivax sp.]|nr:Smr/MutS family protein [Rubrivivax sp.]MCL4696150.1 Smr/MutS family protein [Burkholderiaceae bacterium]